MNAEPPIRSPREKMWLIFWAWCSILIISELPDVLFSTITGQIPAWLVWGKPVFLICFVGLCFTWKTLKPLRPYALIMLVFFAALVFSDWVSKTPWWQGLLNDAQPSFFLTFLRPFIRDTAVTLVVIGGLWLIKRRRKEFFLTRGQISAPIQPVRWLGIPADGSYRTFGWIFAGASALAVAVPTVLGLPLTGEILSKVLPLLPVVLLYAAINAFNEEIYFRTTLLSTLPQVVGRRHALMMNVMFFGMTHYLYGAPPGILGFALTGFLGWLLGKSMLETKGLFWPWMIHFLPDVVVFLSYAILWLNALNL